MSSFSCVYRRPSGIYVVRLVVPLHLRPLIGKRELHASTGLREKGAAQMAALHLQIQLRHQLMALDFQARLRGPGSLPAVEAAALLECEPSHLLTELLSLPSLPTVSIHVDAVSGWLVDDPHQIERDFDENGLPSGVIYDDLVAKGVPHRHTGFVRSVSVAETLERLRSFGESKEGMFLLSSGTSFFLDDWHTVQLSALHVSRDAVFEVWKRYGAVSAPSKVTTPTGRPYRGAATLAPSAPSPGGHTDEVVRVSDVLRMLRDIRIDLKEETHRRRETEVGYFVELMGDLPLAKIDRAVISRYAQLLKSLPVNIGLARRKAARAGLPVSLADLTGLVQSNEMKAKSWAQVKRHMGELSELFTFASKDGLMKRNPAADFRIKREAKRPRHQQREKFTDEELVLIFSQDWFVTGRGTRATWKPFHYWLPLLGLYTGARLREASQLFLIAIHDSGAIPAIRIEEEEEDEGAADDDGKYTVTKTKSVKTSNSVRTLPIHSHLLKLGFLDYVRALCCKGEDRLFPELRFDAHKGYGKDSGRWFNELFLGKTLKLPRNGKKVFHSFRHNFTTLIDEAGYDEHSRERRQLIGHERGSSLSAQVYTKDRELTAVREVLESLKFVDLSHIASFDTSYGVTAALRAKRQRANRERNKG